MNPYPDNSNEKWQADFYLRLVIGAVLIWGVVHALGAYLFNWDLRKPLIVLACVGIFLGGWGLLLRGRRRKLESAKPVEKTPPT